MEGNKDFHSVAVPSILGDCAKRANTLNQNPSLQWKPYPRQRLGRGSKIRAGGASERFPSADGTGLPLTGEVSQAFQKAGLLLRNFI